MGVWDWQEREGGQQMCCVVINLPSGVVNDNKNFTVAVTDDCRKLEVEMTWPSFLVNTMNVHKWLKNPQDYHPRLRGCEQYLAKHRVNIADDIKSKATILLPFKVLKRIGTLKRFTNKQTMTSFVYIDLIADQLSDYGRVKDEGVEEI